MLNSVPLPCAVAHYHVVVQNVSQKVSPAHQDRPVQPRRLLFVNYEFPPVGGGAAYASLATARELVAMGVNHLQIRFAARSAAEFCEQTAAFGADVGPLLAA